MNMSGHSTVGILGGDGRTGRQFRRLFASAGCTVRTTSFATRRKNPELMRTCDIVIFALPLEHAADIIRSEAKNLTRKDQLILDVSSLKVREVAAMMKGKGEVIGMHPLFGPSTDPKGERVILCPARVSKPTLASLQKILKRMGLRTSVMSAQKHDDLMATIQVIPHLKSLLMAEVMGALRLDLKDALRVSTPVYEMEFNVIARFLDDDPELYMPILFRNPRTVEVLRQLQRSVKRYLAIAKKKDIASAKRRYLTCKQEFEPFLKRARAQSEACIKTLLSLTR